MKYSAGVHLEVHGAHRMHFNGVYQHALALAEEVEGVRIVIPD